MRPLSSEEVDKVKAETELVKLDVKLKKLQLDREAAEDDHARKLAVEELKQERAASKTAVAEAEDALIDLGKKKEAEKERKATNKFHHVYMFDAAVSDQSVSAAISQLEQWHRLEPGCEITLRIFSPGGDV